MISSLLTAVAVLVVVGMFEVVDRVSRWLQ